MKAQNYNFGGLYDGIEFPDYVYHEYPKLVRRGDKERACANQREELAFITEVPDSDADESSPVVQERDQGGLAMAKKDAEIAELRQRLAAQVPDAPKAVVGVKGK